MHRKCADKCKGGSGMRYRLIELRKSRNLTQGELANILCTTQSRISRIENNLCEISPFLLADMAEYFKVSPEYIKGESQNKGFKIENKIVVKDINEYDEFLLRYKSLSDEHKAAIKLILDYYFQIEAEQEVKKNNYYTLLSN